MDGGGAGGGRSISRRPFRRKSRVIVQAAMAVQILVADRQHHHPLRDSHA